MKKFFTLITTVLLVICMALFAACGTDNMGGSNNGGNGGSGGITDDSGNGDDVTDDAGGGNNSGDQTSDDTDNDGEGDDGDFVYYTVTFDSLGGSSVESQRILAGNPARAPLSPTKDNYDFVGWYDSAEGGALWNFFTDRVNQNITLFAHWAEGASSPKPTDTLTFEKRGEGYAVTGDSGQAANIVIPAEYDGKPVIAIADSAFAYSKRPSAILSVIIPNSVTEIGKNAFYNQSALVSVEIGEDSKLEKIGNNAFSGNSSLESIYLPAGLSSLGDGVFYNCGGLEEITVARGNTDYSGEGNCLIDLTTGTLIRGSNQSEIPHTVTTIGEAAFRGATVTALTIPASVTEIQSYAFSDCAVLATVTCEEGSGLTTIGNRAFAGTSALKTLTIPASVTSIGSYLLRDSGVTEIIFLGTKSAWDSAYKAKNWNYGKTDIEIACSDDNA